MADMRTHSGCAHDIGSEDEGCSCCRWNHGPRQPNPVFPEDATRLLETISVLQRSQYELCKELEWALSWMVASERERQRDHYERAVRLTGKPDPQAWRDKHK